MVKPIELQIATMKGYKTVLEGEGRASKNENVSVQMAREFNKHMEAIKAAHPEHAVHLIEPLSFIGKHVHRTGYAITPRREPKWSGERRIKYDVVLHGERGNPR